MSSEKAILSIAAVVMLVAAISLGFTYYSISSFKDSLFTGYVTANGTIYINITSAAAINLTTDVINFSSGRVSAGSTYAVLSTSSGTVVNGSWANVTQGFVVENIGNVNVTISLKNGKTNQTFIGGTGPLYQLNVTNNEAGACVNVTALSQWYNANISGVSICSNLSYLDSADTIRIDVRLGIPYDAPSSNGAMLSDQVEVTAVQAT
jgi:hypothetical protein